MPEATKSVLEKLGYHVTTLLDGANALKQLSPPPRKFDLVITAYGMPQMNGKQLTARIKQICPTMPIILMTGYADLIAKENITVWGIDGLLLKPFNLQEINKTVIDVLARAAG